RFEGGGGRGGADYVWLDNIRITVSAANATNALPPPPVLLDGYTVPPLTNMTVTMTAEVNDPLEALEFVNTATMTSDQQTTPLTSSVTNEAEGIVGMSVTKTSLLSGTWDLGETNLYEITIENTGTVAQTGVFLTDVLPTGAVYVSGSVTVTQSPPPVYTVEAFTSVGTTSFTAPDDVSRVEVLVVGGGGGGGTGGTASRGGGGAGGIVHRTNYAVTGGSSYTVTVGGGGGAGTAGGNSDFDTLTGLGGGEASSTHLGTGGDGGSGGGGNGWSDTPGGSGLQPGSASGGYGNDGGAARSGTSDGASGGGGGAGAAGADGSAAGGGNGGDGLQFTNFTAYGSPGGWFGGGGGGGSGTTVGNPGSGGTGGGGAGGSGSAGTSGTANTGGGGGGATTTGGSGGSGIVLVRYSQPPPVAVKAPPNLVSNATLSTGVVLTVRFAATMTLPLASTQFINTATLISSQQPPREASVTNFSEANAVGDFVWFDADGDGVQDGGEGGLTGVVVQLYDTQTNLLLTTTSGVNGAYAFTNLPTGDYFLDFSAPSNYTATAQDQGGSDALDSDISTNTGQTAVFTLSGGTTDTTRDAGFYQPASSIGNFVWNDLDGDGVQDGGSETGMPGVVVTLYGASSNVVGVTTTSVAGAYSFTNLPTGSYFLEFTPPADFTYTLPDQGGSDAADSDASPVTGRTAIFYLPPGTADTSRDAGLAEIIYGLTLSKTSDAATCLSGGNTITYTLTIENTGTTSQAGITLEDVLPAGLTYVTDSATVAAWGSVTNTWRDEFSAISYAGQDGTANWAVDWQEADPAGTAGPTGDYVGVTAAGLTFHYLYVGDEAAWRWADLSGETNATLSLDWETDGLDANEFLDVRIATGPDGTFTQLAQLGGTASGTTNFDITAYISTGTTVRFEATPGTENWESGEYAYIDNIQIEAVRSGIATNPAGAPPALVTNLTLGTGQTATVVFQTTLDSPPTVTQLLNTASAYSAVQPAVQASVTNCAVYADVGVTKFVTETEPDQAEIIDYWVVVTNNGPETATGLEVTDLLPDDVQYNSHSNGTWDSLSGVWDIGTLAVGASTTLYFNVTVYEGTGGKSITNTATIMARDLYDPVASNDTSSVVIVPTGGATVGDRVWLDLNADGIQDAGETNFIANVPVALLSTNDVVVTSMVTSAEGLYEFENLLPGTYYIRFDLTEVTTNAALSPAGAGGDGSLDSDVPNGGVGGYAWTTNFTLIGGQTNLDLDMGLRLLGSTRAMLADVWGEWYDGSGRVVWQTASEWNTAGFHVYRVDPESGAEARVNTVLVHAALDGTGARYELEDPLAEKNAAGVYRLEETELTGGIRDLGRHAVAFRPVSTASKAGPRAMNRKAVRAVAQPRLKRSGPSGRLRATWRKEGLYALRFNDLAAGMGLAPAQVESISATNGLRLECGGRRIQTIHDETRGRLVFYGPAVDNWYARDNAVLIFPGAGESMPRRAPGASRGTAVFPVQERFEQDRYPFDSAAVMPEDLYYWDYVISGHATMGERNFPLDLSGADGDVGLVVRLQGWSSTTNDPDHLAELSLNGEPIGTFAFDGQDAVTVDLVVPAKQVLDGANSLTVKGVLQDGRTHSYFVVDRVDASFDRWISPLDGTACFQPGQASAVWVPAFEQPWAVALDADGRATWIAADGEGRLPGKAWAVDAADAAYAVIETDAVPVLEPEPVDDDPWFLADSNRIDYLVLTSRELESTAQALADYRAGQGLRAGVAAFEDVCDWMTGGVRTPEAIPALLAYAQETWVEAPWLVVLAGNGHYDFLGALSNEVNHIPPLMVQTLNGIFAADNRMADADGDGRPDAAIGRLPAITTNDLAVMIDKIQAYEEGFGQNWQNQLVLAADLNDPAAGDFSAANARLAALTDGRHPVLDTIDLNETAVTPARNKLVSYFNSGAGIIHYTGHGGAANWSGQSLLRASDVASLHNPNRPPVTVALSCLVGRFEAPGPAAQSLGELLLRQEEGGAVAAWGPSGLSHNDPAVDLGEAFYRGVMQDGLGIMGLAVRQAVDRIAPTIYSQDTLAVYNLLGDPALRIADNLGEHPSSESFAQWRWQRFSPQDLADPGISAGAGAFAGYALGDGEPVLAELPEFGFLLPEDAGNGFILRWKRRIQRGDIRYRLSLSEDLESWEADSPDLDEVGSEPDPDGVMETVRTRVERPNAPRVFLTIQAERK
ncbi:MAG TPA: SdrD B-like domain-containing protein, partial [Kiritimatiellia bacterium]|nr:SdrD B-like domain-containing protein [Kiritimatiellia bacterium]